jgi:Pro-kumamolisin, activation domain/Bacterial Ig-like domain (group 3)
MATNLKHHNTLAISIVRQYLIGIMLLLIGELAIAQVSERTALVEHTPAAVLNNKVELVGRYAPDQMVRLVYGLRSPHPEEEEQFLRDLQTKGSPNYHKFLTAEQWNARFAPSEQDEKAVVEWARSQGLAVSHRYPNRMLVDVEAPVAVIEKAHTITINRYRLGESTYFSNNRNPAIPVNLAGIIRSVGGLNNLEAFHPGAASKEPTFPTYVAGPTVVEGSSGSQDSNGSKPPRSLAGIGSTAGLTNGAYDPTDLFSSEAYNANALYALGHCCNPLHNPDVTPPETSIAIVSVGRQDPNDFVGFHNQYPYLAYHFQQFFIDGTPPCCDGEGTMDMEWATAMSNSFGAAADTAMVYLYDGVNNQASTFNDIYNHMLTDGRARIMSSSWGCAEIDCATPAMMETQHAIFNAMVGQGWTLIGISHDGGATTSCHNHVAVSYPGSDPNFVSAGGTQLSLSLGPKYNSEVAWSVGPFGCSQNDGGSGGGISFYWKAPPYQDLPPDFARQVPDIALNADWVNSPQNVFFGGTLSGNGGTSIVAPEVAGFFANVNAYLLHLSTITGGLCNGHACVPLGNANYPLYWIGQHPFFAAHNPFYDITSGCNNNDVTAVFGLGFYCAGTGRDMVTGWGSFNMLQLAWDLNDYMAGGSGLVPFVRFTGPTLGRWYNSNQVISWSITNSTGPGRVFPGLAGYRAQWPLDPGDPFSQPTPGSGNSFYSGPQVPNGTSGCLDFTGSLCPGGGAGQGWHTAHVRAWDNTGHSSLYTYGGLGFDSIPPQTTASVSGAASPVQVKLTATDNASGVAGTLYQLDGGSLRTYTGPFAVAALGAHNVSFHSVDVAGNVETTRTVGWTEKKSSSTSITSSKNPSVYLNPVTFTATVAGTAPGSVSGTVTFKSGNSTLGRGAVNSGKATLTTATLPAGAHSIVAIYSGNSVLAGSTSPARTQTISKAATTNSVTASINPSKLGTTVTFTATIKAANGGVPTGTVTFKNGTVTMGTGTLSAGKANFSTSRLTLGLHSITAVYSGNNNFNANSSAALSQTVKP